MFECFGQASASTRSACAKQRDESEHFLLLLRVCVCVLFNKKQRFPLAFWSLMQGA